MAENKKKNPFNGIVTYFKDVKGEMKKVAWPTLKQVEKNTIIVLVCVIIIGLFIALLDFGFGKGYDYLVNKADTQQTTNTVPNSSAGATTNTTNTGATNNGK